MTLQADGKKPELTNSEALLNKLEAYVKEAIESGVNIERWFFYWPCQTSEYLKYLHLF